MCAPASKGVFHNSTLFSVVPCQDMMYVVFQQHVSTCMLMQVLHIDLVVVLLL